MPTQPLIQWVPWALSLEARQLGREADHSPLCSAEVKNSWRYTSTPQYAFMALCSVKAQGRLYLYCHVYVFTTKMQIRIIIYRLPINHLKTWQS
jgi:hypothetical protein